MTAKNGTQPWFVALLTVENLLIVLGAALLLCSFGDVSLGSFGFRPAHDTPAVARLLFTTLAFILALTGTMLHLKRANLWSRKLSLIHFAATITSIAASTLLVLKYSPSSEAMDARVFMSWGATQSRFESRVDATSFAGLEDTRKLMVICRKYDAAIPFEDDVSIQKSATFDIDSREKSRTVAVEFDRRFSNTLSVGDSIECAACVLPTDVSKDRVYRLGDVKTLGGQVRQFVWFDLPSTTTHGRPN